MKSHGSFQVQPWDLERIGLATGLLLISLVLNYKITLVLSSWSQQQSRVLDGVDAGMKGINPFPAKLIYLKFQTLKFVSRNHDPQLQVAENYSFFIFAVFEHKFANLDV